MLQSFLDHAMVVFSQESEWEKCPSGLAIIGSTNSSIKEGEDGKWSQQETAGESLKTGVDQCQAGLRMWIK